MLPDEKEEIDVNALINDLKNDDVNIRLRAVSALSEIRDQTSVKPLIDTLETEQHDTTIAYIFGTLRILKGEDTKLFFKRYLKLRNEKKLKKKHLSFYDRVIKTLVEYEDSEIDDFLYSIFTETDSQGKSAFAEAFVIRLTEEGQEALLKNLEHEYYEVRLEVVKNIGKTMTKKATEIIEEEIQKKDSEIQTLFYDKLKELLSETGFRKDYIDQRKKEWLFEDFALSNKFWLVKIKEFISRIFGEQWISQNIEDSRVENELIRTLNEKVNYRFKDKIKDILWNFGSEKTKSIFLDSELEKKISDYIYNKDAKSIVSIIHNYHDLEGEKVSYDNILEIGMKGLERIGTEEAIEKLLDFIRYTGGDYSGHESIFALHALDRIGGDYVLQELYAKFLKGLTGIKNEFFVIDFVTIVGKHNLDLLLDIFSTPEEDFYFPLRKYNDDVLHLKSYIINAFGTLKDPICIEPLVNAFVDSGYDDSIKEALIKINEPEETIDLLLEKYNYYTNLLYTLFGKIRWILRSLNISIDFTDFSSFADIKHFNFYLTRLEKFLSSVLDLDSISYLENDISIDSTILDRIKTSSNTINPEEQLRKTIISRFGKSGFKEYDYNLLDFNRTLHKITQKHKYNSDKAAEEIILECCKQEEILTFFFEALLVVKKITHKLALALVKFGFKDLSEDDVTDIVDRNIVREMFHPTENDE